MKEYTLENGDKVSVNEKLICSIKYDGEYEILSMLNGETLRVKPQKSTYSYLR